MPDTKTKRHIFKLHTSRMSLSEDVDLEELIMTKDDLSGADIKAVCSTSRNIELIVRDISANHLSLRQ
jgi:ATP-dependent 26S proteasome regulatory subunit